MVYALTGAAVIGAAVLGLLNSATSVQPAPGGGTGVQARSTERTIAALGLAYTRSARLKDLSVEGAKRAESEGVPGAASLLRTSARAMEIHGGLLREQIVALGGETKVASTPGAIEVKGTVENLGTLGRGLSELHDAELAAVKVAAEAEGCREAGRAARFGREGVSSLARLVKQGSLSVDALKKGKRPCFVGRSCGLVVEALPATRCPTCGKGRDDFEKVE